MRREKEKTYRPPPAPEVSLFPNFAYKMKKRTKAAVINTTEVEVEQNVADVEEVTKDYPLSKQQRGSTTPSQSTASRAKSDSQRPRQPKAATRRQKRAIQRQRATTRLTTKFHGKIICQRTNSGYARNKDTGQEAVRRD